MKHLPVLPGLSRYVLLMLLCLGLNALPVQADVQENELVQKITNQTNAWLNSLTPEQQKAAVLPFDIPSRTDWHYFPKETRKGVKLRDMSESQRELAHKVLAACLTEERYVKAVRIMDLEKLLHVEEGAREGWRDYLKFYYTLFGDPRTDSRWGLSIEGHHLSLNFVFDNGKMVSSTPQFFAVNPAIIKSENTFGFEMGSQVLQLEQDLAFELLDSLNAEQKKRAVIAPKTPRDVHNAAKAFPPQEAPAGLPAAEMTADQKKLLRQLIESYTSALPEPVATRRMQEVDAAGFDKLHFAWAGATEREIGHYYRVQGPKLYIEFINHQQDVVGNEANHIHSMLRDFTGDFDIPVQSK